MMLRERNSSSPISGNDRWVDSSGSRRSPATVRAEAPGTLEPRYLESCATWRAAQLGELRSQSLGLAGQGSEAGSAPEQLIGLPHERLGTCQVSERDVDAGELSFVDRRPREGLAVALGPLRQQRGLAVTRRRDHRDNRMGITPRQPFDQQRTAHRPGPHQRTQKLGRDEAEDRPARAARSAGALTHVAVAHAPRAPRECLPPVIF
jgi:hypothetical protein